MTGYTNLTQRTGAEISRLTKPFRQAELAVRIAELLDAARPNDNVIRWPEKKSTRLGPAE